MPSEQPTSLSNKRRIFVMYVSIEDVPERQYFIDDRETAQEWADRGEHVVEYAKVGKVKQKE